MPLPPDLLCELENMPRQLEREQRYEATDLKAALAAFRDARSATLQQLRSLSDVHLARTAKFAEYGRVSLRGVVHYLRSHDQQHLAGIHWLAGKIASRDPAD